MNEKADVIIAGAGLSGLLALQKLNREHPDWNFVLIEREPWLGGRMRPSLRSEGSWGCGLQALSPELFDYALQKAKGDDAMLGCGYPKPRERFGVLSAQKIQELPFSQMTDAAMAKVIGGNAAARDWSLVEELLFNQSRDSDDTDHSFSQAWKGDRKSGALIVLEHLARLWGMPELSPLSVRNLASLAQRYRAGQWVGRWDQMFEPSLANLREANRLHIETSAQVMSARFAEKQWTLATTRGVFQSNRLIVAQSPWEAVQWLPKDLWPSRLLNIASKTKPVSVVVLSDLLTEPCASLPDTLLVPAEEVQIVATDLDICYQATLQFELTVQAPAVVKAVKRLKRAKKKLQAALPDLKSEGDHLALLPVGWAHAATPQDQRWFDKLDMPQLQRAHLAFVGESYGSDSQTERNLMSSVEDLSRVFQS